MGDREVTVGSPPPRRLPSPPPRYTLFTHRATLTGRWKVETVTVTGGSGGHSLVDRRRDESNASQTTYRVGAKFTDRRAWKPLTRYHRTCDKKKKYRTMRVKHVNGVGISIARGRSTNDRRNKKLRQTDSLCGRAAVSGDLVPGQNVVTAAARGSDLRHARRRP